MNQEEDKYSYHLCSVYHEKNSTVIAVPMNTTSPDQYGDTYSLTDWEEESPEVRKARMEPWVRDFSAFVKACCTQNIREALEKLCSLVVYLPDEVKLHSFLHLKPQMDVLGIVRCSSSLKVLDKETTGDNSSDIFEYFQVQEEDQRLISSKPFDLLKQVLQGRENIEIGNSKEVHENYFSNLFREDSNKQDVLNDLKLSVTLLDKEWFVQKWESQGARKLFLERVEKYKRIDLQGEVLEILKTYSNCTEPRRVKVRNAFALLSLKKWEKIEFVYWIAGHLSSTDRSDIVDVAVSQTSRTINSIKPFLDELAPHENKKR